MKLFKVYTDHLGEYYVIADSFNEAESKLKFKLDEADYGFTSYRIVTEIEVITEEVSSKSFGKPYFSDKHKLIL